MSDTASLYFQSVVVTGVFLLLNGLPKFETHDLARFLVYLALGMLSATWKVQLPSIQVTQPTAALRRLKIPIARL